MAPGSNINILDWLFDIEACYTLEAGVHKKIAEKRSFSLIFTVVPSAQIASKTYTI